jgi:hypothetical protein
LNERLTKWQDGKATGRIGVKRRIDENPIDVERKADRILTNIEQKANESLTDVRRKIDKFE